MYHQEIRKPEHLNWMDAIFKNLDAQRDAVKSAPIASMVCLTDNLSLLKGLFREKGFGKVVDKWEAINRDGGDG